MKIYILLLFSLVLLVSCSDEKTSTASTPSDFDLSTIEGMCRYAMKKTEKEPDADPAYVRSITDVTCTTTGGKIKEWQCLTDKMDNGKTMSQAESDCFEMH